MVDEDIISEDVTEEDIIYEDTVNMDVACISEDSSSVDNAYFPFPSKLHALAFMLVNSPCPMVRHVSLSYKLSFLSLCLKVYYIAWKYFDVSSIFFIDTLEE